MEKIKRELEFKLTEAEFSAKAHELAGIHAEIHELDTELKGHKKRLGDQIKERELSIGKICRMIESGIEVRTVDCEWKKNFDTNTVEYYFEGKLIDERAMDSHERQAEMFKPETTEPEDIAEAVFKDSLV